MLFGRVGILRPRKPGTVRVRGRWLEVEDHGDSTAVVDLRVGSRQSEQEAWWVLVAHPILFGRIISFLIFAPPYQGSRLVVAIPDNNEW